MSQQSINRGTSCRYYLNVDRVEKGAYLASFSGSPLALYVRPVVVDGVRMEELIVFTKDLERRLELSLDDYLVEKSKLITPYLEGNSPIFSISEFEFLRKFRHSSRLDAVQMIAMSLETISNDEVLWYEMSKVPT